MYMGGKWGLGCYVVLVMFFLIDFSFGNSVFNVEHKFGGKNGVKRTLSALRAHDLRRQGCSLAVDVPFGGSPYVEGGGFYFGKFSLGTPPKDYYLQVDTGSTLMWINYDGCKKNPKKSSFNVTLSLYNPKDSKTAKALKCEDPIVDFAVKHKRCKDGKPLPSNCHLFGWRLLLWKYGFRFHTVEQS